MEDELSDHPLDNVVDPLNLNLMDAILKQQCMDRLERHEKAEDFLELSLQRESFDCDQDDDHMVAFPVYMDHQLRFLDKSTAIGRTVSKSIVETTIDDDCATDEEIQESSARSLAREL